MTLPEAEIVIAVHTADRPVRRAVESVLASAPGRVGATVVCHNMVPGPVREQLAGLPETVRLLELADGIPSPAGPFNYGLDQARAGFVGIMGSDDTLEPGAVSAWLDAAYATGAAAVIAPVRYRGGARILTPRARVFRGPLVDPLRDRLAYRTAPLGLIRREAVSRLGLRLSQGLRTGEDLEFGLRLWFSGEKIAYPAHAPAYLVGQDADERVTAAVLPLSSQFQDVTSLVSGSWFQTLPAAQREAIAVKLLRGHVISAALRRGEQFAWGAEDRQAVSAVVRSLTAAAPGAPRLLSAPDERLLLVLRDAVSGGKISAEVRRRAAAGALQRTFTRRWLANLRREAPLRTNLNSLVVTAANRLHRARPAARAAAAVAGLSAAPASDRTDGRQPR
ncbi:MAG TPA: glycosyltransferase [Arthrobacter sp.]|nr:glycosyltransferase [Arthrobacter sp.]